MKLDLTDANERGKCRLTNRALLALAFLFALPLSGCMHGEDRAISALSIDPITTSSIAPLSAESEIMADEKAVFELVGNLEKTELAGVHPWSNALTGSAGVISDLIAFNENGKSCRRFQTTRHGFDGVALFNGQMCQLADGSWQHGQFKRVGE